MNFVPWTFYERKTNVNDIFNKISFGWFYIWLSNIATLQHEIIIISWICISVQYFKKVLKLKSSAGFVLAGINLLVNYRVLDSIYMFLIVWYYCTLTIRESILKVNGSRIKVVIGFNNNKKLFSLNHWLPITIATFSVSTIDVLYASFRDSE